ncbi:hypothetical protein SDC9_198160 [bioreactor metagenome]|uniref:Uncharacterized protein n=1 Tax=bioreactor metagenome TaxID=1076179 RepID=A0A645ITQ4_9ZZZZ
MIELGFLSIRIIHPVATERAGREACLHFVEVLGGVPEHAVDLVQSFSLGELLCNCAEFIIGPRVGDGDAGLVEHGLID